MLLGLLGYYPWHYGVMDFLNLGIETLTYVGDLVTLIDILSRVLRCRTPNLSYLNDFIFLRLKLKKYSTKDGTTVSDSPSLSN